MRQLIDNSGATALPNPIESSAIARPQEPVLLTDEGTWTARELRDAVRRCAAALVAGGVEPRTRVGLIGPPSAEWVIASHAIGWLGGSVTPLPHDQPVAEIEKAVAVANPAAVVVTHGHDKSDLQTLERLASGRLFEMRALTGGNSEDLTERFWPWDEERATLLTSGTTGVSQPISLSTSQIVMSAFGSTIRLGHQPDDRWLACLPLNHVGGFQIMMRAALEATSVVLHPRFVATRVAKALDSGDITLVSLVPTMLERVLEVRGDVPFPDTLRAILVGGAGISAELMERCRVARAPVSLTWGMTEAASQITTRYPGELSADGGSGAPLPFVRVRAEESGTLTVYGPTARGVHRTRDLGFVDEQKRVHITGRVDDTIVSGGENISPSEVENVLRSHDDIRDAIVVGVPDIRWGERPLALLVAATQTPATDDALRDWCRERLAKFKVPEHFLWVDEIPLGPLGKRPRSRARKLAQKVAPELFASEVTEETQPAEAVDQLIGDSSRGEALQINGAVDQFCRRPHGTIGTDDGVSDHHALRLELLDGHLNRESFAEANRAFKVRFGVNQRRSPVGFGSGTGEHVASVPEDLRHQLLEGLVAVLKDAPEKNDSNLIDFVKARRQRVLKRHFSLLAKGA